MKDYKKRKYKNKSYINVQSSYVRTRLLKDALSFGVLGHPKRPGQGLPASDSDDTWTTEDVTLALVRTSLSESALPPGAPESELQSSKLHLSLIQVQLLHQDLSVTQLRIIWTKLKRIGNHKQVAAHYLEVVELVDIVEPDSCSSCAAV